MTRTITALSISAFCVFVAVPAVAATVPAAPTVQRAGMIEKAVTGAPSRKPPGYRSKTYSGGQGATWKTGRDSHGFQGTYGGCKYTGFAGPGGYDVKKVCR